MRKVFKKGDIVRGLVDNGYNITNEDMIKGKVISIDEDYDNMTVEILEHKTSPKEIGQTYEVTNDDKYFEKVCYKFDKSLITDGVIVTLDNGDKLIYLKDRDEFKDFTYDYDNNLEDMDDIDNDGYVSGGNTIVKIECPIRYSTLYIKDNEIKEMTLEEVCNALGYEVKIKKD